MLPEPCSSTSLFIRIRPEWTNILGTVLTLSMAALFACAPVRRVEADENARILRIENDIVSIDATGADSGSARPLLSRMAELKVPGVSIAVSTAGASCGPVATVWPISPQGSL